MKGGHIVGATTSLNVVKIACKLVMLSILPRSLCKLDKHVKSKIFLPESVRKSKFGFYEVLNDGQNSMLLSSSKILLL